MGGICAPFFYLTQVGRLIIVPPWACEISRNMSSKFYFNFIPIYG